MDELILTAKPEVTRKRGEDGYRTFSIRIKEETVEKLDALAAKTGRTRNELWYFPGVFGGQLYCKGIGIIIRNQRLASV